MKRDENEKYRIYSNSIAVSNNIACYGVIENLILHSQIVLHAILFEFSIYCPEDRQMLEKALEKGNRGN